MNNAQDNLQSDVKKLKTNWQSISTQLRSPEHSKPLSDLLAKTKQILNQINQNGSPKGKDIETLEEIEQNYSKFIKVFEADYNNKENTALLKKISELNNMLISVSQNLIELARNKKNKEKLVNENWKSLNEEVSKISAEFKEGTEKYKIINRNIILKLHAEKNKYKKAVDYLKNLEEKKKDWSEIYNLIKSNLGSYTFGLTGIFVLLGVFYLMGFYGPSDYLTVIKFMGVEDLSLASIRYTMPVIILLFLTITLFYILSKLLLTTQRYPSILERASNAVISLFANKIVFLLFIFVVPMLVSLALGLSDKDSSHNNKITVELSNDDVLSETFESFIFSGDYYIFKVRTSIGSYQQLETVSNSTRHDHIDSSNTQGVSHDINLSSNEENVKLHSSVIDFSNVKKAIIAYYQKILGADASNTDYKKNTILVLQASEIKCLRSDGSNITNNSRAKIKVCKKLDKPSDAMIEKEKNIKQLKQKVESLQVQGQRERSDFVNKYFNLVTQFTDQRQQIEIARANLANFVGQGRISECKTSDFPSKFQAKKCADYDKANIEKFYQVFDSINLKLDAALSKLEQRINGIKNIGYHLSEEQSNQLKLQALLAEFEVCRASTTPRKKVTDTSLALVNDHFTKTCFDIISEASKILDALGKPEYLTRSKDVTEKYFDKPVLYEN